MNSRILPIESGRSESIVYRSPSNVTTGTGRNGASSAVQP